MIVVLLGPPACGKGTQSESLIEKHGFKHVSTGQLLREEVAEKTDLGLKIKDILSTGSLINDEIVLSLLKKSLDFMCEGRILLDGFPRTVEQAKAFDQLLEDVGQKISSVVDFQITEDLLYRRVAGRFACAKCGAIYHEESVMPKEIGRCDHCGSGEFNRRADDKPETLSKRLVEFDKMTAPLRQYYIDQGVLNIVDAAKSVEQIRKDIESFLKL
ncbi:MAG: Adenylate kinase [Holosporales bacterium]